MICLFVCLFSLQTIKSLCLRHCNLQHYHRDGIQIDALLESIERLISLESLDLSYNLLKEDSTITKLGTTFGKLPNLTKLQLSGNRLTRKLSSLLRHMQKPLVSLDVSYCGLDESDISFLANSCCTRELKELFVGYNNLARDPESLFKLLTACSVTLEHISLAKASLGNIESAIDRLIHLSPSMKSLHSLNLKINKIDASNLAELVSSFAMNIPTLKIIQVPLVLHHHSDDVLRRMTVQTRLSTWDTVNFNNIHLVRFVERCVRRFRESQRGDHVREVHVLITRGEYGDLYLADCCLLFQF